MYVFGDSYTDSGETIGVPYGMTWPGVPGNRSCDRRNEVDYLGKKKTLPPPLSKQPTHEFVFYCRRSIIDCLRGFIISQFSISPESGLPDLSKSLRR